MLLSRRARRRCAPPSPGLRCPQTRARAAPDHSGHPSSGGFSVLIAARALRTPSWKLAIRSRVASAEMAALATACTRALADPGTMFAWGTRRGKPAEVTAPTVGAEASLAARHPSSAADVHSGKEA